MLKNINTTLLAGCLALGFSTINAADSSTAKVDDKPAWPQSNGPFGNFNPRQYGCKLVDDLKQVKTVWTSEENDLGYAKTGSSGFIGNRANWPGHPGSASGIIAAEGMIFAASFRPVGDVWADKTRGLDITKFTPEQQERLKRALSIDADDFVVAIDQVTGKTVWKTVEEKKGLFRGMGKRGGWGVSPAYYAGKVFSMGTTGLLYCYDSKTGKKVWESNIGKTHEVWETQKKKNLEKKELPAGGQQVSLVIADGVLIAPLYDTDEGEMSLGGVDVQTGKILWQVADATAGTATPALWRHDGHEYVLTATRGSDAKNEAKMRLISPKEGKVLWTVEGLAHTQFSLAPSEKSVMVNVGSKKESCFKGLNWMLLGCYRLSLEGAQLVWTMPDENDFFHEPTAEASEWRKYLIRDGKVYYNSFTPKDKNTPWVFSIFDEATGKLLFKKNPDKDGIPLTTMSYLLEDRMLTIPDASHSNTTNSRIPFRFWTTDPKDIRAISDGWNAPHPSTTGYNVFMEFPYVDGRIYMRAKDGTVRCYDLRAEAK